MDSDAVDATTSLMMCRLCLTNAPKCLNLFGSDLKQSAMHQKIVKYINVEIDEDDPFPNEICCNCMDKLEDFHEFCETVVSNQEVLRCYSQIIPHDSADQPIVNKVQTHPTTATNEYSEITEYNIVTMSHSTDDGASSPVSYAYAVHVNVDNKQIFSIEPLEDDGDVHAVKPDAIGVAEEVTEEPLHVMKCEEPADDDLEANYMHNEDSDEREYTSDEDDRDEDQMEDEEMVGELGALHGRDHQFAGFPKEIVRNAKIVVNGEALWDLLSRFYSMKCELCPESRSAQSFVNLAALSQHHDAVHGAKCYVVCCGLKLVVPRMMALHMARHLQPSAFQCTICDKMMTCPKILQHHYQNHLPEAERPLACPQCPRRFSYGSALMSHAISHKPEHEREAYVCDECGKTFSSPGRLSTHTNLAHASHTKNHICHICARQFSSGSNLKYHLTTHQPRIHQMQCEQCGKWLKNKLCLRKHMAQHSNVRLNCDRCDYSAINQQCLRNHMRIHHTDAKPFSCEHCDKSFKLRKTLINHLVQHTGVHNFSCEFCSRTFASSGNYYSHRKRMHPQELAAKNKHKEEAENEFRAKVLDKRSPTTTDDTLS